jgi:hypothetical protein
MQPKTLFNCKNVEISGTGTGTLLQSVVDTHPESRAFLPLDPGYGSGIIFFLIFKYRKKIPVFV